MNEPRLNLALDRKMRNIFPVSALLLVAALTSTRVVADPPEDSQRTVSDPSSVSLGVANNQDSPVGSGFLVSIAGWKPGGLISVYLVGPKGERIPVVPTERKAKVSPHGEATFQIPYKLRGVYPGSWQLIVAGESGIHLAVVSVP